MRKCNDSGDARFSRHGNACGPLNLAERVRFDLHQVLAPALESESLAKAE
jgi:hypothetical protein